MEAAFNAIRLFCSDYSLRCTNESESLVTFSAIAGAKQELESISEDPFAGCARAGLGQFSLSTIDAMPPVLKHE